MATVLILGAGSDIARAIAVRFAMEKHNVQLAARNLPEIQPFESDLQIRYGISCTAYHFDALDFSSHRAFYDSLQTKPDITICVFGYMKDNEVVISDFEETRKTIDTNFTGAISILNIVAEDYTRQQKGSIAGISSVAGERGRQSNYIYGSAKAGFTAYLSGLRNRCFHYNVQVTTILPGFVYTKMTEHLNLPKLLTARPEDVADTVFNSVKKKKDIVYVKWFWRWIMLIIKNIPESIFKKKML